jgi:hypothetical protein
MGDVTVAHLSHPIGYVVFGPTYYLLPPEGGLFPSREAARERALEIAEDDDWWVEPIWGDGAS